MGPRKRMERKIQAQLLDVIGNSEVLVYGSHL